MPVGPRSVVASVLRLADATTGIDIAANTARVLQTELGIRTGKNRRYSYQISSPWKHFVRRHSKSFACTPWCQQCEGYLFQSSLRVFRQRS